MKQFRALLLGVAEYDDAAIPALPCVASDLPQLAAAFKARGYAVTDTKLSDRPSRNQLRSAVLRFLDSAKRDDTLVIYLSGHGAYHNGIDYLLPGDADLGDDMKENAVSLSGWQAAIDNSEAAAILFLVDACREGFDETKSVVTRTRWSDEKLWHAQRRQVAWMFPCAEGQVSRWVAQGPEIPEPFSLFARALVGAVSDTAAPRTLGEFEKSLRDRMAELTRRHGKPSQDIRVVMPASRGQSEPFQLFPDDAPEDDERNRVSASGGPRSTFRPAASGRGAMKRRVIAAVLLAVMAVALVAWRGLAGEAHNSANSPPAVSGQSGAPVQPQSAFVSATLTDPVAYGRGDVQAAVFSPDGKMVATVDSNGSAYLWDLASPSHPVATITDPVPALAGDAGVTGLVFSPDGKMVATADADNSAYVWDLASPSHPVATITDPDSDSLTIGVSGLAFSPDGKMVATGDGNGSAYLWDLASPSHPVATLTDPDSNSFNGGVNDVEFSPDGKMVATADANDGAYLWDVASPSHPVATLTNPDPQAGDGGVTGLVFSPDGKIVATADGNGSAYLWDVANPGHPVATLTVPDGDTLNDVVFSPDGKMVATADADNSAYLWDVANPGHPVATITDPRSSAVSSVAFSPDGKMVATADDSVSAYLWKLAQPLTDP